MMDEAKDIFDNVVLKYTSEQAEDDGYLFDVSKLNEKWEKGLFNYVTTNLLSKGYLEENKINTANLIDLLNQALQIVKKKSNDFKDFDYFFAGEIELPLGKKQQIFIEQNETGKYTLLLPEDH